MTTFISAVVFVSMILVTSFSLGMEHEQKELIRRCMKSNPTVSVGDIDDFCNKILYLDK